MGKRVKLPLADRLIPIIADAYVDREFGTGLVKITPAHDPNDFEVGKRHELPQINILNPDGTLNDAVPAKYRGLKVKEARKLVVADLKAAGLYVSETPITHSVGHCYRCRTVVEPYLSEQWFVRMKPLAEKALKAWKDGEHQVLPAALGEHLRKLAHEHPRLVHQPAALVGPPDPSWHCAHCGKDVIAREDPLVCPFCGSTELEQDEDVLDTWFSSWLWPFSTLGWPKDTADLRKYYPTTTMVTGYDIIFFWVARMIMAGLEFTGQVPFRDINLTTIVRDKQGRKMSKSLGNGIDPLEIVDLYGADALKFTLAFLFTSTQDILIDKDDFKLGSKFANKIWNASRYILMNLEGRELVKGSRAARHRPVGVRSPRRGLRGHSRGSRLLPLQRRGLRGLRIFWNDFCDWYLEATKLSFRRGRGPDPPTTPRRTGRSRSSSTCSRSPSPCSIPSCRSSPRRYTRSCPAGDGGLPMARPSPSASDRSMRAPRGAQGGRRRSLDAEPLSTPASRPCASWSG